MEKFDVVECVVECMVSKLSSILEVLEEDNSVRFHKLRNGSMLVEFLGWQENIHTGRQVKRCVAEILLFKDDKDRWCMSSVSVVDYNYAFAFGGKLWDLAKKFDKDLREKYPSLG